MGNICSCFSRKSIDKSQPKIKDFKGQSSKQFQQIQKQNNNLRYSVSTGIIKAGADNKTQDITRKETAAESKIQTYIAKKIPNNKLHQSSAHESSHYQKDNINCLSQQNIQNITKGRKVITHITSPSRQVVIRSCKKSEIYLFDITKQIRIQNCSNTLIFCAPCAGKITIHNCKNLKLVLISCSLEISKSKQCEISLFCSSSPVLIESSEICFSNYPSIGYQDLPLQLSRCKLQVWNNNFIDVCDLNQNEEEEHFSLKKQISFEINLNKILQQQGLQKSSSPIPMFWRNLKPKHRSIVLLINEPNQTIENKVLKYILQKDISIYKSFKGNLNKMSFQKITQYFPEHTNNNYFVLMVGKELQISGLQACFEKIVGEEAINIEKIVFP